MRRYCVMALAVLFLAGCQGQRGRGQEPEAVTQAETALPGDTALEAESETSLPDGLEAGGKASLPGDTALKAGTRRPSYPAADAPFDGSTVSIVKSDRELAAEITREEIEAMVRAAAPDLADVVKNNQTVVIKPNLVQMKVDSTGELLDKEVNGVTTDWRVTDAVVKLVRERNPEGKVYIMEGSASGPTSKVMEYFHYTPEYIKGVDGFIRLEEDCGAWQDFDAPEVVRVDLPEGLLHQTYYFNRILYEADVVISLPCLKTSSGVVVTAGIKNVSLGTPPGNLYGVGPNNPSKAKMVSHKIVDGELDRWIYDYYCAKPVDYVIVDGLQGFQSGPVPMSGERKETDKMNMGVILGGKDAVAVDTICSLIVGWDPESVGYLNLFRKHKGLGQLERIRVKGIFVDELRKHFTIKRPELGGVQIADDQGPELSAECSATEDQKLEIRYKTDEEAYKAEVYADGCFLSSEAAIPPEGTLSLDISKFSKGTHQIELIVYDRFLNHSAETMTLDKMDS